jgi:hypothetical protein
LKGKRLKRISGEDCDCFSKGYMTGWLAATQVIVIKRRKVVMDEGVGMQHLDRCAQVDGAYGKISVAGRHTGGFHAKDGAQALPAGKDTVAHGAMDGMRERLGCGEKPFQGHISERDARGEQRSYRGVHLDLMINEGW